MKVKLIILFLIGIFFSINLFGYDLNISWNPSTSTNIVGYNIYFGSQSKTYTNVTQVSANTTNFTLKNFYLDTYYFAATSFDINSNESDYSSEFVYHYSTNNNIVIITNNLPTPTFVGIKIDYGTNLLSLSSKSFLIKTQNSSLTYFYSDFLTITNYPLLGIKPNDTNNYVYLIGGLKYGTNFLNIKTELYDLISFTNPPYNQFYRASLILTNQNF